MHNMFWHALAFTAQLREVFRVTHAKAINLLLLANVSIFQRKKKNLNWSLLCWLLLSCRWKQHLCRWRSNSLAEQTVEIPPSSKWMWLWQIGEWITWATLAPLIGQAVEHVLPLCESNKSISKFPRSPFDEANVSSIETVPRQLQRFCVHASCLMNPVLCSGSTTRTCTILGR